VFVFADVQKDLDEWKMTGTERTESNPQVLWETYKTEIRKIAQNQSKKTYHKIMSKIRKLEEDRAEITTHPDFDKNVNLRTSEAIIASKLTHLEKTQAKDHKDFFNAQLMAQGERLGGVWSKLGKTRRPRDLIYRLKIPNQNPPQYECHSK
jgi:hypothetical protein